MDKLLLKPKKPKGLSREELLNLSKEELVDRLIQLEAHNAQLKNIINKRVSDEAEEGNKPIKNQKKFDFSKHHTRPILLHILYFGWDYNGLVVQEDTLNTIEYHLFNALTKSCLIENRETSNYHRCGRTDKGVSAFGQVKKQYYEKNKFSIVKYVYQGSGGKQQVISITVRSKHPPEKQDLPESLSTELEYCSKLNRLLPQDIRVVGWMPIQEGFSARFDCKKRQYKYYFPRSSLDIVAMKEACAMLVGNHDFRNLCKMDVGNGVTEFRRQISRADIVAVDDDDTIKPTSMYYLLIEGNAFLWHQIRCIEAILLLVGSGFESPDIMAKLLDSDTYDRKPQYNMAIDVPLNLFECSYELKSDWIYDREDLAKLIKHFQGQWTLLNIKVTMLKDCLQSLENKYSKITERICTEGTNSDEGKIVAYHDVLTEGIKPKTYKPLLKRPTCSTLQEKIEHYKKRRK